MPTSETMRKVRSSVRFADEEDDSKGKERDQSGIGEGDTESQRGRSNSQVLTESDDSDTVDIPRVQSQLSMLIKDKRKQSGSQDLGPSSQSENAKTIEAKKKREELLKMGRKAAAPIIPTSRPRRPSEEENDRRYRSPSPQITF